jgi:hypothetical protein
VTVRTKRGTKNTSGISDAVFILRNMLMVDSLGLVCFCYSLQNSAVEKVREDLVADKGTFRLSDRMYKAGSRRIRSNSRGARSRG